MMSTGEQRPTAQQCAECDEDAELALTACDGDVMTTDPAGGASRPMCPSCATAAINGGGRVLEYPLETYFTYTGDHASVYESPKGELDFYDEDDGEQAAWISAKNDIASGSSVELAEWA